MRSELDQQYERFLSAFTDIELIERAMRDSTKDQYRALMVNAQNLKAQGLEDLSSAHHTMTFRSLRDGETRLYRHVTRNSKQLRHDLLIRQNKQYQSLLAEAYERFEDYVEFAYGAGGALKPTFWRPKELQGLHAAKGATPTLSDFVEHSNSPHHTGDVLWKLGRFRTVFGTFKSAEQSNQNYRSTRFVLVLVEMLRHVIVHNGGRIKDKSAFVGRIFTRSGLSSSGNDGAVLTAMIDDFLGTSEGEVIVHLLDVKHLDLPGAYTSRIGVLIDLLLAYANCIQNEVLLPLTAQS